MAMLLLAATLLMAVSTVDGQNSCSKIVTSNVGLTPTVGDVERRSRMVAQQYSQLDADVVCAQEFWHEEDIIRVLQASPSFRYHYSPIHAGLSKLQPDPPKRKWYHIRKPKPDDLAACKPQETFTLLLFLGPCILAAGCASSNGQEQFAECAIRNCENHLTRASEDCVSCIFQTVADSIKTSITECHSFTMGRRYNAPGLLLLSKKEVLSVSYTRFFSERMMLQRGYIKAEIQDVGTVVCTHLSSNIGGFFEYDLPPQITDYRVQQREEIDRLDEAFGDEDNVIILGDLNTGPDIPENSIVGEFAENYAHLVSLGYQSPYVSEVGNCTYCTDNKLVAGRFPSHVIDHVLLKDGEYTVNSIERILDFNDPEPMSDHYAVQAELCGND